MGDKMAARFPLLRLINARFLAQVAIK